MLSAMEQALADVVSQSGRDARAALWSAYLTEQEIIKGRWLRTALAVAGRRGANCFEFSARPRPQRTNSFLVTVRGEFQ